MKRGNAWVLGALLGLFAPLSPALPTSTCIGCSICNGGKGVAPLRQDAQTAKLILYGKLVNARVNPVAEGGGTTELQIEKIVKSDPWLGEKKVVEIQRYVKPDPANDHFLIFCDIFRGKLDPYRGEPVSADVVSYLQKAMALDGKDRIKALLFYFDYLEHRDQKIANDAFAELARAGDAEIGQLAGKLSAEKLRTWLEDARTPAYRLGLYAFLLGACGTDRDADLLRTLLEKTTERTSNAAGGLLSGYIRLRPKEGWELAQTILKDARRSFTERYAVVGTLRFYHGWKPDESRDEVLRCFTLLIDQGEMADIAVEELRRWETWTLTADILSQYDKKTHAAPIIRRAIVRYALSCPRPEAKTFVAAVRKQEPELVSDVEESLRTEKQK
jgi:hypothetical protein